MSGLRVCVCGPHLAVIAIALKRVHYIKLAQNALISMESERLRNSLLLA